MITDTITWVELVWTVVAVIGTFVQSFIVAMVYKDLQAVHHRRQFEKDHLLHLQARGRYRSEWLKFGTMIGYVGIGVAAMFSAPANGQIYTPVSLTIAIVLIASVVAAVADSMFYLHSRNLIFGLMRSGEE